MYPKTWVFFLQGHPNGTFPLKYINRQQDMKYDVVPPTVAENQGHF